MATHPQERRHHSDRRLQAPSADDLHQRLEEKRKQLDRRQTVRRESDRRSGARKTTAEPGQPGQASPPRPPSDGDGASTTE